MTKEGLTSREVAWEFEATFLARMLRREPRSFSGLVNLDEVSGISMMSTGAAHQRPLSRLQISRQREKNH